eukprot:260262-Rhodomonas_salina.1
MPNSIRPCTSPTTPRRRPATSRSVCTRPIRSTGRDLGSTGRDLGSKGRDLGSKGRDFRRVLNRRRSRRFSSGWRASRPGKVRYSPTRVLCDVRY